MSRKTDLEQAIRESYEVIKGYEDILRTSNRPEEKVRARRVLDEQWVLVEGYLAEVRPLVDNVLPDEIAQIAAHFSALAELSKIEQALDAQEALRGVLPDDQLETALTPFRDRQISLHAQLWGGGAVAQGRQAKAAGERGVVADTIQGPVGTGDSSHVVQAGVYIERLDSRPLSGPKPADLRRRYLEELARETNRLPWMVVEQDYAHPQRGEGLSLADVYTALDTTALEGMLICALEGYLAPRSPRRKGAPFRNPRRGIRRDHPPRLTFRGTKNVH